METTGTAFGVCATQPCAQDVWKLEWQPMGSQLVVTCGEKDPAFCPFLYVCMYVCMYVCIYVSMYVSTHLCIYVSMYVSMYVGG